MPKNSTTPFDVAMSGGYGKLQGNRAWLAEVSV